MVFKKYGQWMNERRRAVFSDIGLLCLRIGMGGLMAFGHGLGKLEGYSKMAERFPDPLGVGAPASLGLAIFAEFFCSLLLVLGLATRLALTQLIATMAVAAFIVHAGDPLFAAPGQGSKEFALVYLLPYLCLFFTGPGRLSFDHLILKKFVRQNSPAN